MGGAQQSVDLAFHAARAQAPEAELVYNDFMSWGAGSATHRAGVLRLLEGFRARGVPVDTLGIQSHLVTSGPRSEEHTSELQSLMRISYAVFCLKKKKNKHYKHKL